VIWLVFLGACEVIRYRHGCGLLYERRRFEWFAAFVSGQG